MSFINNPVVSSLANSLGLGGLTQAGSNPLVASAAPKVAPKASAPNQPEYKQARFFDPRTPAGGNGTMGSGMPTEPGAMSPDVQNNPTVTDLLNHFGVHPQQSVDPGLFIHSEDAWAKHPVVSGILDGLLGGLANTKGSDTVGEGLSNVAQGLATTQAQKTAHINAQLQMPYQQAMTVASLQDQAGKQSLQEAQQKEAISRAHYYDDVLDAHQQQTATQVAGKVQVAKLSSDAKQAAVAARPKNIDTETWNASLKDHLNKLVAPGEEPTDADMAEASKRALQDVGTAKQAPKTAGAIAVSNSTQANKVALKQTAPGSSAAAMISAGKNADPVSKAAYTDADKDVQAWPKMKAAEKGAALGKPFVIPGSKEDTDELNRRVAVRDAARLKLGAPSTASKYSSNNPYAPR